MQSGLLTLVGWAILVWNAQAQEQSDRAKYELIRETINFLATDNVVSKDTSFRVSCETLDYECFEQQLAGNPIAGIDRWYDRWKGIASGNESGVKSLRDRIFADILERPGKGYRKQLAGYDAYVARTADLITPPAEQHLPQAETMHDTASPLVPDHAGLTPIYPEHVMDRDDNSEKENTMIAYFAFAIGLVALVMAALPVIKKKSPKQLVIPDGTEELHRRLDGIALRMKNLEHKIGDTEMADAVTHLTEIMESVEKRVVDLENRSSK